MSEPEDTQADTGPRTIRIMVVDDNPVVRSGLVALLETSDHIEVIAEAADGRRAIELAGHLNPDLVLLDVRMPLVDGIEAAGPLSQHTRVLMLTYTDDADVVRAAIRNGAVGYLVHGEFSADELENAVSGAVSGTANPLSPVAVSAVLDGIKNAPAPDADGGPRDLELHRASLGLSAREAEVMERMTAGLTNGEIASELFLSEKTVKNHVNRIYSKLAVESRAAAIALWLGTSGQHKGQAEMRRP